MVGGPAKKGSLNEGEKVAAGKAGCVKMPSTKKNSFGRRVVP